MNVLINMQAQEFAPGLGLGENGAARHFPFVNDLERILFDEPLLRSTPTAIAVAAFLSLMTTRSADASLSLEIKVGSNAATDVTSLLRETKAAGIIPPRRLQLTICISSSI